MSSGHATGQVVGTDETVGTIIRLYHRRRGWSWVGFGSLIGEVVYLIIGISLFTSLTGLVVLITFIPLFVLPVLAVVGLVAALVDTIRLHRFSKADRAAARPPRASRPAYHPAHLRPRRHTPSWVAALIMVIMVAGCAAMLLPAEVDGAAYVVGAGRQDTFHALHVREHCTKSGCHLVTDGYLSGSGTRVTLSRRVPAGTAVPVRDPVWSWGTGKDPVSGAGDAAGDIIGGLFFDGITVLLFWYLVSTIKTGHRAKRRRTDSLG